MENEMNTEVKLEPPAPATVPKTIDMQIIFDRVTGQVSVAGPLENKILALWMLTMAQKAVHEYDPAKSRLVVPNISVPATGGVKVR